jgi:hypothetical protein
MAIQTRLQKRKLEEQDSQEASPKKLIKVDEDVAEVEASQPDEQAFTNWFFNQLLHRELTEPSDAKPEANQSDEAITNWFFENLLQKEREDYITNRFFQELLKLEKQDSEITSRFFKQLLQKEQESGDSNITSKFFRELLKIESQDDEDRESVGDSESGSESSDEFMLEESDSAGQSRFWSVVDYVKGLVFG